MMASKKIILIPIATIIIMSCIQCSSAQFDKKAPATITQAIYQDWVGGRPGSKGTLVTIKLIEANKKMTFDSIYFNGKAIKIASNLQNNELTITGNFRDTFKSRDIILHADPKEEFGNKVPKASNKIPFELQDNEAVISYFIRSKKRYFKISNIKKVKTLYYQ